MDPTYPLIPVANVIASTLVLVPLILLFRTWQISISVYAMWICVKGLTTAVRAVVWNDNTRIVVPLFCDIVTHLDIGADTAFAACVLVTNRRLYIITSLQMIEGQERLESRKRLVIDLALCCGLPSLCMCLYYIVQNARYVIVEGVGCRAALTNSGVTFIVLFLLPLMLIFFALFYCSRTMWHFYHRCKELQGIISANLILDRNKFLRILVLNYLGIFCTLLSGIITVASSMSEYDFDFWPGWFQVHSWESYNSTDIEIVLAIDWVTRPWCMASVKADQWIPIFLAIIFFSLFGLTCEARGTYVTAFLWAVRWVGYNPARVQNAELSDIEFGMIDNEMPRISNLSSGDSEHT